MGLPHNPNPPRFMHVDKNSFFASAEQQKFPLWRGKPMGVTPVNVPGGAVIAPSRELKTLGAKTGIRNRDARLLADGVVLTTSTPNLYRHMSREFMAILRDYCPTCTSSAWTRPCSTFPAAPRSQQEAWKPSPARSKRGF